MPRGERADQPERRDSDHSDELAAGCEEADDQGGDPQNGDDPDAQRPLVVGTEPVDRQRLEPRWDAIDELATDSVDGGDDIDDAGDEHADGDAVLVLYVHHIGRSLRVSALIELVGEDTRKQLDVFYPQPADPHPSPGEAGVVPAPMSGVVCHVDVDRLVARARDAGCSLELVPALGEFTASGAPLLLVRDGNPSRLAEDVTDHVHLGLERTLEQDVAYGLRMLVDIAERSLADSPFLDPTTAVQAIDRLHDCLRQLARRPFPDGLHRDDEGVVRLTVPVMSWEAYVHLAFDEIRQAGASSPQVARRLRASLEDLRGRAPAERIPVIDEQIALLEEEVRRVVPEAEVAFSLVPDRQGIGVRCGAPCAVMREAAEGM